MTQSLVYEYRRIEGPGHSWLEVPVEDVRDLAGVFDEISAYSPIKRRKFYLEEDCDLYTFYKAMEQKGYTVKMTRVLVDDFEQFIKVA